VEELRQRAIVLAGAALLAAVGRNRLYQMAQDKPGILGRLAAAFCSGHAARPRRIGDQYMWWHNYFGYLETAGFRVERLETRTFVYSWNPHAQVVLVDGCRA
jgi:hypothetical protein